MQQLDHSQNKPPPPTNTTPSPLEQQPPRAAAFIHPVAQINSPEICQYDVWSDQELEQLKEFLQSDPHSSPNHHQSTPTTTTTTTPAIEQHLTSTTTTHQGCLPSSTQWLHSPLSPEKCHQSSRPTPSPSHHSPLRAPTTSSPLLPQYLPNPNESQPSPKRTNKRTVSSFFTTGNNLPIPLTSHPPQTLSSALDPPPFHPPARTLSSLFQGADRPYPLQDGLEEKGSRSIGENQALPTFGFQTGRGTSVSAPSEQSVKKALELCTIHPTTPFPKRPFKEPESPSPSHRAKIQKPSSSQEAFEPTHASMHQVDTHNPSVGSLSTGSGVPVTISSKEIKRTRALLDQVPQSSKLKEQTPFNSIHSPLKDVSNVPLTPSHNSTMSMKADLLAGSQQSDRAISTSLIESLNAVTSKIPSQPTTAASLMSTPNRPTPKMFPSSSFSKFSTDDLTSIPPLVPQVTTAPVRRISNRMHIGLTPQSSRRVSHEGKPVAESRPFVTPFKKNLQGPYSHSRSVLPSHHSPSTPVRDPAIQIYRQDDTPLLDQTQQRVMYREPNHGLDRQRSGASSHKPQSVYDLTSRMARRKIPLRAWLGPHKGYTARNLLSLAIPESVVFITSKSSLVWTFNPLTDPFGSIHALDQLLKSGCLISRSSPTWVAHHWGLIIWKLAGLVRWRPDCFHRVWNPAYVVEQLKYRYEREIVCGHRSILKRILDRDCLANVPMCLVIVGTIRRGNPTSTSSPSPPQVIELSDGWYKIKAVLDPVLTRTYKRGALKVGFKIAIFGTSTEKLPSSHSISSNDQFDKSKSTSSKTRGPKTQQGKSLANQARQQEEEEEEEEELKLYLEGNSTSRAKFDEHLGFRSSRKPWFASLKSVTFDGGKIPLMDLIVTQVHEPSFLDEGDRRIAHQSWDFELETKLRIAWENEREKELNNIMEEERSQFERVEKMFNKVSTLTRYETKKSSPSPHLRNHQPPKKPSDDDLVSSLDPGHTLVEGGIDVESIHSQSSSSSQFDADEMCEELIEEDEENTRRDWFSKKIQHISFRKLVKLRAALESKIESLRNSSVDSVQKKLDMRVPIRRTRKIQLLQVEDSYHSIYKDGRHPPPGRKVRSAQLVVRDLSRLPDAFFKLGHRYWVHNLQPQQGRRWDSQSAAPDLPHIHLTTRRDSHWTPVGLNT